MWHVHTEPNSTGTVHLSGQKCFMAHWPVVAASKAPIHVTMFLLQSHQSDLSATQPLVADSPLTPLFTAILLGLLNTKKGDFSVM